MRRIRLAWALGLLALIAFGLAAMRGESDLWQSAVFTLTLAVLSVASLGALLKRGRGPGWVGFAVFGWIYFLAVAAGFELITTHALDGIYSAMFTPPTPPIVDGKPLTREEINALPGGMQLPDVHYLLRDDRYQNMRDRFTNIGNMFLCVVCGVFGVLAGVALDPRRSAATQRGTQEPQAVIAGAPAGGTYERP